MSLLKRIIFLVLLIILIIVVGHFSNSIANWGMALKWHMFNDNEVVFHEMKLNLPLRWWVDSKNEEQLILNVVPPHGINFYGIVVFRKKMISKEELFSRISFKKAKGDGGRRKKGHTYFF